MALISICLVKSEIRELGGGSVVKSTGCSSRGPRFESQHPVAAQNSNSKESNALFWLWGAPDTHRVYRHKCRQNTHTQLKKKKKKKKTRLEDQKDGLSR